jgi:hypothetical protein
VLDGEAVDHPTGDVHHADRMRLRRPVDPDEHDDLLVWQHESGPEDITRADFYGFVVPFAIKLRKLSEESGMPNGDTMAKPLG